MALQRQSSLRQQFCSLVNGEERENVHKKKQNSTETKKMAPIWFPLGYFFFLMVPPRLSSLRPPSVTLDKSSSTPPCSGACAHVTGRACTVFDLLRPVVARRLMMVGVPSPFKAPAETSGASCAETEANRLEVDASKEVLAFQAATDACLPPRIKTLHGEQ